MKNIALTVGRQHLCWIMVLLLPLGALAQVNPNAFQPMTWEWPTPNDCRLGSGAPGPGYWQQRADYRIAVELDEQARRLSGQETITYTNQSPHTLTYLWVQLDQNLREPGSLHNRLKEANFAMEPRHSGHLDAAPERFEGGCKVSNLKGADGQPLRHQIVHTNMRIDLDTPLRPGEQFSFSLNWEYQINDATVEGRSGYELFPKDGNAIFEIAQFYPRMCVYHDQYGWQNKPFSGEGEFALEFGDFEVAITVPDDHLVAGTGELANAPEVLTATQRQRMEEVYQTSQKVRFIVSPEEAAAACKGKPSGKKTWKFRAENVRDFAFASSRKFVWDAATVEIGGKKVLAQSFYPQEGMPLWDRYATHAIMHTLQVYSELTVDYPYPQATAVHGAVWGMEYPMICFCGGRPNPSGFYSRSSKYLMIGVVMHEVGHNFFPMIINSDERRWAWMDEGLNSFCQYQAEIRWEPGYIYRRGPADDFAYFMAEGYQNPIMTNPESIVENGSISYEKTTVGLTILRNEVMGPEVFDPAFKEYARRWAFRHPQPADFFRTMEDASGVDLDWFWRSWFYGTDPVDMDIALVQRYLLPKSDAPEEIYDATLRRPEKAGKIRYYIDDKPELKDEYSSDDAGFEPGMVDLEGSWDALDKKEKKNYKDAYHVYHVAIVNAGGCPMPVTLGALMEDGSVAYYDLPAEIWQTNMRVFFKEIRSKLPIKRLTLDPEKRLPDVNRETNTIDLFSSDEGERLKTFDMR